LEFMVTKTAGLQAPLVVLFDEDASIRLVMPRTLTQALCDLPLLLAPPRNLDHPKRGFPAVEQLGKLSRAKVA
jgi:hypothetical protein